MLIRGSEKSIEENDKEASASSVAEVKFNKCMEDNKVNLSPKNGQLKVGPEPGSKESILPLPNTLPLANKTHWDTL